jgi:hypothetical protein
MMTLTLGIGSLLLSRLSGTWVSHSSSSAESSDGVEEYHEPAWLAALVVMLPRSTQELDDLRL